MGPHQVITVSLICVRELDLVQLVLYHQLAAEEVIERPYIGMVARESTCLLYEVVLSIESIAHETGGHRGATTSKREGLAVIAVVMGHCGRGKQGLELANI